MKAPIKWLKEYIDITMPLAEIAPALIHPVAKKTITELLKEVRHGVQGIMKLEDKGG